LTVLVVVGLAVLVAVLFVVLGGGAKHRVPEPAPAPQPDALDTRTCPLCGSLLARGEKVHSVVFATKTQDKIMEISGCPHCRPPAELRRVCPVCKKDLRPMDVVTARVFERANETGPRKTHVHVLGCPRCRANS
jgi:hypothetical protein